MVPDRSEQPPVLDPGPLTQLRSVGLAGGKPELVETLVAIFLEGLEVRVAALKGVEEATELKQVAHSLKGSCLTLGARRLAALAHELEEAGAAGVARPEALARLSEEAAALQAALRT